MSRYIGSKTKICKKFGTNIYGNPKFTKALGKQTKKKKIQKKLSEYGTQLKEKQLARYTYGLSEKQFKKYFVQAYRSKEVTGTSLLKRLEIRADNALFRSGIASTRNQARQMISHGHFELNGHKITVASIVINPGDKLTLRHKMITSPLYVTFSVAKPVKWLSLDKKDKCITIDRHPEEDELEQSINVQLIVEYYSR